MPSQDQVFRDPSVKTVESWRAMLNGRILSPDWQSKGAAVAGLEVERRRLQAKQAPGNEG